MSKSKGNGIDPFDVIEKFGADALRFGMAHLTTETQDVRIPTQFECPHCDGLIEQTKKNRELPRLECPHCSKSFSTQWAESDQDRGLPRGPVVSERFEVARNFGNKLWNAARFAMMHLEDYEPATIQIDELLIEDRWILSRLSTVTKNVTESLEKYHYSDAARELYDFAWDEYCSFYLEMLKDRFVDDQRRGLAQRMVAHTLDVLLRLLHPIIPFITEEIWQLFGQFAISRGLTDPQEANPVIITAEWPTSKLEHQDPDIEQQFSFFQVALAAVREIRSRQNLAPKTEIDIFIRAGGSEVEALKPLLGYFPSMARAHCRKAADRLDPPAINATVTLDDMEVIVDLTDHIDRDAEKIRLEKEVDRLAKNIAGKKGKLSNDKFVKNAPPEIVEREREGLAKLEEQLASVEQSLRALED